MSLNLNNYPNITSVTVFIRNGNNNGPYDNCYWDDLQFKPDDKADPSPKFVKYYYIKDHLGSVRQTLDTLGNIIVAQDYFPYGEVIPGRRYILGTPQEKYKFTGKERDVETNLDYFGARFYNSKIGRWLSVDPIAEKYPGWNPFNYCFDNPLRLVDPNGKGPFDLTFPFELYKLYVIIKINVNSYFNSVAKNNNTTFRFPT